MTPTAIAAPPEDPNESQRSAADPSASIWVAASAGTGKTKVLTQRALALLLTGVEPRRILCITFTRAAAAEMRDRLAAELAMLAAADEAALDRRLVTLLGRAPVARERDFARTLFGRVLDAPGGLQIVTIHAFCQSLLARFPIESGVAPHFRVMDDRDAVNLRKEATLAVIERASAGGDPALTDALAELTRSLREARFDAILGEVLAARGRLAAARAAHGSIDGVIAAIARVLGLDAPPPDGDAVTRQACADRTIDKEALARAADALTRGSEPDQRRAAKIRAWLQADPAQRVEQFDDYATVYLTTEKNGRLPKLRDRLATKGANAAWIGAEEALRTEAERLLAAAIRIRSAAVVAATAALLRIAVAVTDDYQQRKRRTALLDYDDLIDAAGRLLESDGGASWVLYKLDGGVDHVLIDEAQDTSAEQWRVIAALTSEFFSGAAAAQRSRTIFAVGDVKQSIFSFQGADPRLFLEHRERFGERVRDAGGRWRPIALNWSFRSTRAVLAAVDATFRRADAADGVVLDDVAVEHASWRKLDGGVVEIWPCARPRDTDRSADWRPPIEEHRTPDDQPQARLAATIARRIAGMIDGGEQLASQARAIRPGDFMVLVRRRTAFVENLVRELKRAGVAVTGVDRMTLTDQLAVMDLVALGRFALTPDDDLNTATVLKGPLIGLEEEALFRLAHHRAGSLWAELRAAAEAEPEFSPIHRRLADILAAADRDPPFEFFSRILGPLGGRRAILERLGLDAEDPLAEFLQLAIDFERVHTPSLEGFLHWVERGAVELKRDAAQDAQEAVRIMTVHGSKGLQAPIVFLPDTMQIPTTDRALLWAEPDDGGPAVPIWTPRAACSTPATMAERGQMTERRSQEHRRLLYVAMTRAADRLIICGWENKKGPQVGCWNALVRRGLEDLPDGEVERVWDADLARDFDGDGAVLRIACPQQRTPEAIAPPAAPPPPPPPAWLATPPAEEIRAAISVAPSTAGEWRRARRPSEAAPAAGIARGRLIHALLQALPETPPERRDAAARRFLERPEHGLSEQAQAEILARVRSVLEEPAFADAFGPGSIAEAPVAGVVGGRMIVGRIDRLALLPNAALILDYKTDRDPPDSAARVPAPYLRQLAAYRSLIVGAVSDRPARCALLWTETPTLMEIPCEMLDLVAP